MYVAEYIDPSFEALSPANTAREARLIMEAQDIEALPVVSDDGTYITMLSLEDVGQLSENTTIEVLMVDSKPDMCKRTNMFLKRYALCLITI